MSIENGQCLHIVLFGTFGENKYFLGSYKESFDIIGFNANIIAHAPEGMAAFISQLSKKSYFIDPQTHAFQQPTRTIMRKSKDDKLVVKKSISSLANKYGSAIEKNVGKNQIFAGSLIEDEIEEICKNTLLFEINKIQNSVENLEEWEFLKDTGIELRPEFLVAPYFYLEPDNLDMDLEDNMKFLNKAKSIVSSSDFPCKRDIFAELIIHKEVLFDSKKISAVIDKYKTCIPDGFLIWIDDFSEVSVSEDALKKYKNFLIALGQYNKPIIVMHGSYFSIVLAGKNLGHIAGVGHGIEYGEHRDVIPVGGGVPRAKFYFPKFHKRISYHPDTQDVLLEKKWIKDKKTYLNHVCKCSICQETISSDVVSGIQEYGKTKIGKDGKAYPTAKAMDKSRRHYLNNKIEEYHRCSILPISKIINELKASQKIANEIKSHTFNHLRKWANVLES